MDCRLYYNVLILEEEFRGIVVLMVRNWFEYKMLINIDLNEVFFWFVVFDDYIIGFSNR